MGGTEGSLHLPICSCPPDQCQTQQGEWGAEGLASPEHTQLQSVHSLWLQVERGPQSRDTAAWSSFSGRCRHPSFNPGKQFPAYTLDPFEISCAAPHPSHPVLPFRVT